MKMFHSWSPKVAFKAISYLFILMEQLICILYQKTFMKKKDFMEGLCKNDLKIFLIKLCRILHARRKDNFCFYEDFTNQTFTFISSKVVYVKKNLEKNFDKIFYRTFY